MPLNYSKWDALELSDDSDIEGHPNVDKKSLIRWKQRDIHEKRELRKHRIAQLQADLACNAVLAPRLRQIVRDVEQGGPAAFSALTERFKTQPAPDAPPTNAPGQKTYDEMLLALLLQVWEGARRAGAAGDDPRLRDALVEGLQKHVAKMAEHQEKLRRDLEEEEAEAHKHITSDDIHVGFDSHYVPPKPEPPPVKGAIPSTKEKVTEYEVLNPRGVASSSQASSSKTAEAEKTEEEEAEELPQLTPSLEAFSHLPLHGYEKSWEFIKAHRDVIVPGASDALLVAAFEAQSKGTAVYAKKCVHQSLLLSYCEKLGGDGVRVFFQKMIAHDPRACGVFEKDVEDTYAHLVERVRATSAAEARAPQEQIQLVPENPASTISFNVPDGAPPARLQLEGPGFEGVDIEDVRRALQMRWDVFQAFAPPLQAALRSQSLAEVNKVLGEMKVEDAEEVVRLLDVAGILNFSEHGVKDETGADSEEGEEADEEDGGEAEDVNDVD